MTIASETSRVNLVGDGVNDTFTFTFEIYVKTDLLVYVDDTEQDVDINYTVPDGAIENPDGGDIVFGAEYIPADGAIVSIILNLPYTQLIDYVEADKFPAETHERGLDRLIKIAQQLKERVARGLALLESSQYSDLSLPDPVASKLLAWKDDLSGLKNVEVESEGDLTVTDFIKTLLDDEDAATARATLKIPVTSPLSIPPSAFIPRLDTYDWDICQKWLKNRTILTAQSFFISLCLPQGATVTKCTMYGYKAQAEGILLLNLWRADRVGGDSIMCNFSANWTDGYGSREENSIDYATIDNENYGYSIVISINPDAAVGDTFFTGAVIEFTLP